VPHIIETPDSTAPVRCELWSDIDWVLVDKDVLDDLEHRGDSSWERLSVEERRAIERYSDDRMIERLKERVPFR
jgi:hypothetical protein